MSEPKRRRYVSGDWLLVGLGVTAAAAAFTMALERFIDQPTGLRHEAAGPSTLSAPKQREGAHAARPEAGARLSVAEASEQETQRQGRAEIDQLREDHQLLQRMAEDLAELEAALPEPGPDLWARTGELWATPEFASLTEAHAHELLPDRAPFDGFRGQGRAVDMLGGLPTLEDAEAAAAIPDVACALAAVRRLGMNRTALQLRNGLAPVPAAELAYLRAEELLMATLDSRTNFHHWGDLCRLFAAWSQ